VIWCQAPAHLGSGGFETVTLDVTLNGQDYVNKGAIDYTYYPVDTFARNCSEQTCHSAEGQAYAVSYMGRLATTVSGLACQRWDAQSPHTHVHTPEAYPGARLEANFCRSPGGLRAGRPWCYTNSSELRWEACDVGDPPSGVGIFGGVRITSVQPFGGPFLGGTTLTIAGHNLLPQARVGPHGMSAVPSGALVNFGNGTVDSTPLGGPARNLQPGAAVGELPWHVVATVVNSTHVLCVSPPHYEAQNSSFAAVPVEVSVNGQLMSFTRSALTFAYYGESTLQVRSIYPIAGPKAGGALVTIYGTGFRALGHDGPHGGQGMKCIFGGMPMVSAASMLPVGSVEARLALGDDPLVEQAGVDAPLAAAVTCRTPRYREALASGGMTGVGTPDPPGQGLQRQQCLVDNNYCDNLDGPQTVCVEVTLNNDPNQRSYNCVPYTYFDLDDA